MSEFAWKSPLDSIMRAGNHGAVTTRPDLVIREVTRSLFSVSPRSGQQSRTSGILEQRIGLTLPEPGHAHSDSTTTLLWAGLNQWVLAGPVDADGVSFSELASALSNSAAVVDHSDGRSIMRLSGAMSRRVLAKLCAVDLHPRQFGPGRCAATRMAHMGALLHQIDDTPLFEIHVFRAFAASFYHELTQAAAEYGFLAEPCSSSRDV